MTASRESRCPTQVPWPSRWNRQRQCDVGRFGCKTGQMAGSSLPELDVARVRRWCDQRVPEHVRDQVRVECEVGPRHLTIVERRPHWNANADSEWTRFPIARLRYTMADKSWTLYWRDRNLRFHIYDLVAPSARVDDLLEEIERDPTAIFWGSSAEYVNHHAAGGICGCLRSDNPT